ncbi:arylamine N-acetyltransferase family protein [Fontibacillus sp. BL9]|uniref:arylamine N-acetyltransferase family protein n=1 Tax=Fontibacillus sp. BL9 TaxID=3389971 RepID=UPI0039799284
MRQEEFVNKYLNRLKLQHPLPPVLDTLQKIQKHHLLNIPFENLDIMNGTSIDLRTDQLWVKVVEHHRGGICYELNGLLFHLLREIGFDVRYISAQVLEDGDRFDHVLLLVSLEEDRWLVDVGFGNHAFEPLKLVVGVVQTDLNGQFRIMMTGQDTYQIFKQASGKQDSLEYTFSLEERKLEDFRERCLYFETSPGSRFRKNRVCSLERENGRISLTDDKLILTENGIKTDKDITTEQEFDRHLSELFGIVL